MSTVSDDDLYADEAEKTDVGGNGNGHGPEIDWAAVQAANVKGLSDEAEAAHAKRADDARGVAELAAATEHVKYLPNQELTESEAAHVFAARNKGDLWYVPGRGWLVYEEHAGRFVVDEDAALRLMQQTVARVREAVLKSDRRHEKKDVAFVTAAASARGLKAILSLAQIEPELRASADSFDAQPHLVNLTTGTYDLNAGKLLPHSRTLRLTRMAGVSYQPAADCPRWREHLHTILDGDEALIIFLQRWTGRCLSGIRPSDNCRILMPYGTGANGKTVTVETLSAVLGDYAGAKDFTTWCASHETSGSGQRQDLVDLAGLRLVTSTESGYHHKLDEALLKQYTGGERVAPRGMYARAATVYRPQFSLLLSTNHLPRLEGADQGFWRRFLKMGFEISIPEPDQDPDLIGKLTAELPGIFNWMCEGYEMWRERGLDPPTSVLMETAEYRADIDLIGQFVAQHLIRQEGVDTEVSQVYDRYTTWCVKSGINHRLTVQQLSARLIEHEFKRGLHSRTRRAMLLGVALQDPLFSDFSAKDPSHFADDSAEEFPY